MADTPAVVEYSMTEIATHTTKESTWLVIKDMNDGGTRVSLAPIFFQRASSAPDFRIVRRTYPSSPATVTYRMAACRYLNAVGSNGGCRGSHAKRSMVSRQNPFGGVGEIRAKNCILK